MLSLLRQVLDQQQANLIFCMLVSIPISYLLKLLKQKYLFLALSMTVTLAFQTFLFPTECYFLWVQQQIVYALILFAPRKHVGHYILIESFLALAAVQIRRIYIAYGVNGVDITGIFMMQLFVWVGMGYNYQNGAQLPEKLTHDQKKRIIVQKPDYITYLGYVNFLPACLIGPVYQYRDYEDYLHRVNEYAHIPSPVKAMGMEAFVFVCSLIGYLTMSNIKADDLTTEWYSQQSLCYKFLYIQLIVLTTQVKYISAWSLGMISMKASGFTYNPSHSVRKQDGTIQHNFDKVRVTDFFKFFLNPSLKVKAQGWNISVQNALKKYIYEQIYNPTHTYHSQKQRKRIMNKAQMTTMITSALWHGFYLSYFITFFHWGMCLQISGEFYKFRSKHKKFRHIWEKYPILGMMESLVWHYSIAYFGMAVPLLAWEKVKIYLAETYYIPYIILYAGFFLIIQMRILSKLLTRQQRAKEHTDGRHHQQGQKQLETPKGQQHQQNQKAKLT